MAEKREAPVIMSLSEAIVENVHLICQRMHAMDRERRDLRAELAEARKDGEQGREVVRKLAEQGPKVWPVVWLWIQRHAIDAAMGEGEDNE